MDDDLLTDGDYLAMGIDPARGRELQSWVLERVGYVLDKSACGGSGIFVTTLNDELALLTASHVVVAAILSGDLCIGAYDGGRSRLPPANCITFSSTSDSALLTADGLKVPVHLDVKDWAPGGCPDVDIGMHMVAGGLPGKWKGRRDLDRRVVEGAKVMILWTDVVDVRRGEVEVIARWGLPETLGGMSGGPLFSFDKQLIGVHLAEKFDKKTRKLRALISTRRDAWADLYDPSDGCVWPTDLEGPPFRWEHPASFGPRRIPLVVAFEGWYGTSPSQPSHPRGMFGRIEKMRILNSDETLRFPINIQTNFYFAADDDEGGEGWRCGTVRARP